MSDHPRHLDTESVQSTSGRAGRLFGRSSAAHRARQRHLAGGRKPAPAVVAVAAVLVAAGGIAAAAVIPAGTNGPGLTSVGPVSATDGFPVWYKDKTGLRLENCVAQADPYCPARGPLPDETNPISFPDNYPDEGFYSLTNANLDTANAGKALLVVALEQAFGAGPVADGDQVTFARLRLKITNAKDGVDYKFTTPVGTKIIQTSKPGLVFDTEDIGIGGKGDFTGALGGRIGPFLTWDTFPTDPALKPTSTNENKDTYIGDGATLHKINGSPYGTNIFRIEGPGINPTPTVDACPSLDNNVLADCIETDLFTVQGKLATTSGVTAERATYSRTSASDGFIDVFASSETGPQSIEVADPASHEFSPTGLPGSNGHFFTRVAYTGAQPPANVQVTNTGDVPASSKVVNVVDRVTGTANYNTDTQVLTVNAVSSDTLAPPPLNVTGYGDLVSGVYHSDALDAPPVSVTVTSKAGGSVVLPVTATGSANAPIPAVAQAGPDQTVSTKQVVTLDGSSSTKADTYSWTGPAGITITNPTSATATFTAPDAATPTETPLTFTLTITGPGGPKSATVNVTVVSAVKSVANAGPDQTGIRRGTKVTLDGRSSIGAGTYAWSQPFSTDVPVTITGGNTAQPSFTFPLYRFPASPDPMTFRVTVTSPDGSTSTDDVTITPTADTITIAKALYTASKREWRIDGTSSVLGGQFVTAHVGGLNGPVIGTALVDATGAYSIRTTPGFAGTTGQTVSVESQLGGQSLGFTIRVQ
jgi:hypothetical protein